MANYDYGGGCPCGLERECPPECNNYVAPTTPSNVRGFKPAPPKSTLGDMLKATLDELKDAGVVGLENQAASSLEDIRQARAMTAVFVEGIQRDLESQVQKYGIPLIRVTDSTQKLWIEKAVESRAEFQGIWDSMVQYFRGENCAVQVHGLSSDGPNGGDALTITLKPLLRGTRGQLQ